VCSRIFLAGFQEDVRTIILEIAEGLKDSGNLLMFTWQPSGSFQGWQCRVCVSIVFRWVHSSVFVAEVREDIRVIIPTIAEGLKHSGFDVGLAIIKLLLRLGLWE